MPRPPKRSDLIPAIRKAVADGDYVFAGHALQRLAERRVTQPEVEQALLSGHHESAKDVFEPQFAAWKYAIRGKTVDRRELRVVVAFEVRMLVVTVIDLKARED